MGRHHKRSCTVWSDILASSAARLGPTPRRNCTDWAPGSLWSVLSCTAGRVVAWTGACTAAVAGEGPPLMRRPSAVTDAGNGGTLSCAPSAVTDAGNGALLSWRPSADAVAGDGS